MKPVTRTDKEVLPDGPPVAAPVRLHALPRRQLILTMVGISLAALLAALDQTIVGTAMPRIVADLHGFEQYAWVATAYMVAQTAVVPLVGKLSDLYSRKWLFIAGLTLFLVSSVLCGFSQTMTQLIMFRGLQGISAGIIMASTFTAIGHLFPPSERGKYQGYLGATWGLASVVGPTVGGYITDYLSWQWVFFVNLPFGLVVLGVFLFYFPHIQPSRGKREIDLAGAAALVLSVVPLLLALTWAGNQYPWASIEIVGLMSFATAMTILFVWVESRSPEPIIPLQLFNNRIYTISALVVFLSGMGMFGTILFVPLFVQAVLGNSATVSGNVLTPMMLSFVVGSAISGQFLSRAGGRYRLQALVGMVITTLGLILIAGMGPDTANLDVIRNIVIAGIGQGITMPLFTIAIQNAVSYRLLGVATASSQFFRSIGGTVGVALFGTVMTNKFASEFDQRIPESLATAFRSNKLSDLALNPETMVSPQARETMIAALSEYGQTGAAQVDQILTAMRHSLASAIHDVFVVGALLSIAAIAACLFLKEIPLRKQHRFDED